MVVIYAREREGNSIRAIALHDKTCSLPDKSGEQMTLLYFRLK